MRMAPCCTWSARASPGSFQCALRKQETGCVEMPLDGRSSMPDRVGKEDYSSPDAAEVTPAEFGSGLSDGSSRLRGGPRVRHARWGGADGRRKRGRS
jgi:hypothetical protein